MPFFPLYVSLVVAAGAIRSAEPPAAPVCAVVGSGTAKGAQLFLEAVKPLAKDTVLSARLCLVPPKAGIGSYNAMLTFDSTVMRAVRVDVSGGMQAKNMTVPGVIKLAGAAPNGFARGPLATIVFKPLMGKSLAKVRVTLVEANTPGGASLLVDFQVAGYPATDRTLGVIETTPTVTGASGPRTLPGGSKLGAPHIDSISPSSGKIDPESVVEVALYGKGFAADGNTVQFDAATVDRSISENGGTVLKFIVPTMIPAHGKAQPHRVEAGTFMVKVLTPAGTSNAVRFTVRGEDR
jgi:hypothetical protein